MPVDRKNLEIHPLPGFLGKFFNGQKNVMEDQQFEIARQRVRKKKKFFNHLKAYVIVNIVFMLLSFWDGTPFEFMPMTLFWGMGLAFHYVRVFGIPGTNILTPEWEDEEIRKEMEKLGGAPKKEEQKPALPPAKEEPMELKELRKNYDEQDLV